MLFLVFIFYNLIIAILMHAYGDIRRNDKKEKQGRDQSLLATRSEIERNWRRLKEWARRVIGSSKWAQKVQAKRAVRQRIKAGKSRADFKHKLQREKTRQINRQMTRSNTMNFLNKMGLGGSAGDLSPDGSPQVLRGDHTHCAYVDTKRISGDPLSAPGIGKKAQIKVKWGSGGGKADGDKMVSHREVSDEHPFSYVAVARRMLSDNRYTLNMGALRRILGLPSDASAEKVAMDVLEQAFPDMSVLSKPLTQAGVEHALNTADMIVQNGEKRAEIDRDIRAIDLGQDGQLQDWFKSMHEVDGRVRALAGDMAARGGSMQTRLASLAAAMHYLHRSGRLTARADGTPIAGDPMPKPPPGIMPRPAAAAAAASGRQPVASTTRARVDPASEWGADKKVVAEPRPRLPRYRRSKAYDEREASERVGSKAAPPELRPFVRTLQLPGIGSKMRLLRKPISQADYEARDVAPLGAPTANNAVYVTAGEGAGGRIFNVLAQAVGVSRNRQHDKSLDVERVGRRVHHEPRSVVPPRTRLIGDGANARALTATSSDAPGTGEMVEASRDGATPTASSSSTPPESTSASRGTATPPAAAPGPSRPAGRPVEEAVVAAEGIGTESVPLDVPKLPEPAPSAQAPPQEEGPDEGQVPRSMAMSWLESEENSEGQGVRFSQEAAAAPGVGGGAAADGLDFTADRAPTMTRRR